MVEEQKGGHEGQKMHMLLQSRKQATVTRWKFFCRAHFLFLLNMSNPISSFNFIKSYTEDMRVFVKSLDDLE